VYSIAVRRRRGTLVTRSVLPVPDHDSLITIH